MRMMIIISTLLLMTTMVMGCALGKKEWPAAEQSEDTFALEVLSAERQDTCLIIRVAVTGAVERLYRASIQYEMVGDGDGEGCEGCPFIPRDVVHFTRNQNDFRITGNTLALSMCTLDPAKEYRFRIAGKSELSTSPLVHTNIFITTR